MRPAAAEYQAIATQADEWAARSQQAEREPGDDRDEDNRDRLILRPAMNEQDAKRLAEIGMTEDQIKHMVSRFLAWPLPKNFQPDNGISANRPNYGPGAVWEPCGTNLLDRQQATEMVRYMLQGLPAGESEAEVARLKAERDTPELQDFVVGVTREAAHQRERWGEAHDRSKSAENWFWLVGYLAGKALRASIEGDQSKALHHTISAAAALSQWHDAIRLDASGKGVGDLALELGALKAERDQLRRALLRAEDHIRQLSGPNDEDANMAIARIREALLRIPL